MVSVDFATSSRSGRLHPAFRPRVHPANARSVAAMGEVLAAAVAAGSMAAAVSMAAAAAAVGTIAKTHCTNCSKGPGTGAFPSLPSL
jgi:hypothetical protein